MAHYIIVYLGGNPPQSPEQGQQHMARYRQWLSSLGAAAISPMNPFKNTHSINSDATISAKSSTNMSGYTIIEAESMDKALEIAKACPFLDIGGSLEVSELIHMSEK